MRRLSAGGYINVVTRELDELDLTRQAAVESFFEAERDAHIRAGGFVVHDLCE